MLLTGREGENEAAPALGIDRLAGQPPGHLPDMLLAASEQADVRPAELQSDTDRLAFADDDVHLPFEQVSLLTSAADSLVRCPSCGRILFMQAEMRVSLAKK